MVGKRARKTLKQVFQHPVPSDLAWKDMLAMAEELGLQVKDKGRAAVFILNGQVSTCHKPHGRSMDKGSIAAIRNLLRDGGIKP